MSGEFPSEDWWTHAQRELVEDRSVEWHRKTWKPRAGWKTRVGDQVQIRPFETYADPATRPDDVELVECGWDHEHCELCWEKIMEEPHGQPEGCTDRKHRWLCLACFIKYVAPRVRDPGD